MLILFFLGGIVGSAYQWFHYITVTSCPYFTWNATAHFFNKGRWKGIENIDPQTFTFLYKARNNDIIYGTPCYFKDKNFVYRNDQALFSDFDYATFQVLTGIYEIMSKDSNSALFVRRREEDTCIRGCFEDKDAIYYDAGSSGPRETNGFVRDTAKLFPNTSDYDEVRNKVNDIIEF